MIIEKRETEYSKNNEKCYKCDIIRAIGQENVQIKSHEINHDFKYRSMRVNVFG